MKISKANKKGSMIKDRVGFVIVDVQPNMTYSARVRSLKVQGGTIVREWSIFSAGTRKPKKAKPAP